MAQATRAVDLQTGGGEVLAGIPTAPPVLVATESWPPNVSLAHRRLAPRGGTVVQTDALPFGDGSFDLVVSRHPISTPWPQVARVLAPGGTYVSQQIGAGSVRELADAIIGPRPENPAQQPERARAGATAAGLTVLDLRAEALRMEFFDIAAVIVFLRKVVWTVPDFSIDRYRDQLLALHRQIDEHGPFVAHAQRFLIEARKL
jgi:SAM-dependent methyltransferase